MSPHTKLFRLSLLAVVAAALFAGCTVGADPQTPAPGNEPSVQEPGEQQPSDPEPQPDPDSGTAPAPGSDPSTEPSPSGGGREVKMVTNPDAIDVLVNKEWALSPDYVPPDLVEPNVRFIFAEKHERRLMRAEAAAALEEMFAAAEEDGIYLAGVSGYRSYAYQEMLFTAYVSADGLENAERYSARPGHSEHQTGLAMDISGSTGECAADDCFAGTPEAEWLAAHAHEFGFIVRYPEGKEEITGYMYEPWHVRYLGKELAQKVHATGLTYEEYLARNR
ncbi:D-alanyl-D-alanine carboxypeptidase [Symbiobacterium terraclitae]|uniref:D-alanyl-D-alanine carboxypeptidase n=1 Tax=Symbiobacterium terraclitae TaxID=557451 RepID=A0ABS4JP21_9FIRM|nr:M15 family metallopeptidase [Symbiobacterium terraclitae]MBP2017272.1 D-alanyl-D-alanine carboxypeptidase [Symbiobacterium terraclitae]